jgi:two-component system, chemotaxis family, CheB/CheR fusion protein
MGRNFAEFKALLEEIDAVDKIPELAHLFVRDHESRIVYWSHGAKRLYGFSVDEAIGRVSHELLRTQFPQPLADIEQLIATYKDWEGELIHTTKSGEVRIVAAHWCRYQARSDGSPYIIEVNNDVTEVRNINAKLVAALRVAESANRWKDELLAIVSHELRTPLTPIALWSALLLKETEKDHVDRSRVRQAAQEIEKAVQREASLISDLLDSSRIMARHFAIERTRTEISDLVMRVARKFAGSAKGKGIEILFDVDPEEVRGLVDPLRIEQVVSNIIGNAVKFTSRGGTIRVVVRRLDNEAEIRVSDTGIGIADDMLSKIFDRFRQGDMAPNREHGGLGLGLSIAKHIVEAHGGRIEAQSDGPDKGSTFTVRLLLNEEAVQASAGC